MNNPQTTRATASPKLVELKKRWHENAGPWILLCCGMAMSLGFVSIYFELHKTPKKFYPVYFNGEWLAEEESEEDSAGEGAAEATDSEATDAEATEGEDSSSASSKLESPGNGESVSPPSQSAPPEPPSDSSLTDGDTAEPLVAPMG